MGLTQWTNKSKSKTAHKGPLPLTPPSPNCYKSSTHPGDIFVFVHFWHGLQGSEARSQNTLSKSGPLTCEDLHLQSSTIHPPSPAVLTSWLTPVAPGQTWSQTGGGGAWGRNTLESPPHLLIAAACCLQAHKDGMDIQANIWLLPLLHDAWGWGQ